jgi:hypothetical protein
MSTNVSRVADRWAASRTDVLGMSDKDYALKDAGNKVAMQSSEAFAFWKTRWN